MPKGNNDSRGAMLAKRLEKGQQRARRAPRPGTRQLPILRGVTPQNQFNDPMENVLAEGQGILLASRQVFRYGNEVVMEVGEGADKGLVSLTVDGRLETSAASRLANLFVCELDQPGKDASPVQFPPPRGFAELLLNSRPTLQKLPQIRFYATRPVFDQEFRFLGPGWHDDAGGLIHGPDIEPILPQGPAATGPALTRLPRHLRRLLADFCFRSDADLVNAVGTMLTGMLSAVFVRPGKPMVLVDGNRPGVGKTLLARVIGMVLDDHDPDVIHYTPDDEELAKRICSTVRGSRQSVVLIDNAKTKANTAISSPVIEANSMAPQLSLRILGQSTNMNRPNDLLWFLTMNDTKTSPDLVSRGAPVRLHYDGDPEDRDFLGHDPVRYAAEYRREILGELAGMVMRWKQRGQPLWKGPHRCVQWAGIIGGILRENGLPEFLTNLREAAGEFNTALDDLAALAEVAVELGVAVEVIAPITKENEDQ